MASTDTSRLSELLADELAHDGAVGAAGDLRHDVGHHPPEVAHARRAHLGDRAVHDLLQLLLVELLGHELCEHGQLRLLALDQAHSGNPATRPPRTCQWRWKIVWPASAPTLTRTR